ncbi:hypothetical protein DRO66_00525 [Candidatus Bathyarchaeota archaeon]|nr:MAG: hypothetical protein DRO66_00525 [Candidatus Bathyarchaeota archaeon]
MSELYIKPGVLEITKGWDFDYTFNGSESRYYVVFSLLYFTFYLTIPKIKRKKYWKSDREWGVKYHNQALWFHYGSDMKYKCLRMPWEWVRVRLQELCPYGTWEDAQSNPTLMKSEEEKKTNRLEYRFDYRYVTKAGEVQETEARVYVSEAEWRLRCCKWLPYPRKIQRAIWADFESPVGEEVGSWKGGTSGCSYIMLPGEDAEDTFRRMEREDQS